MSASVRLLYAVDERARPQSRRFFRSSPTLIIGVLAHIRGLGTGSGSRKKKELQAILISKRRFNLSFASCAKIAIGVSFGDKYHEVVLLLLI